MYWWLSFPGVREAPGTFHVSSAPRLAPIPLSRQASRKLYLKDQRVCLDGGDLASDPKYLSMNVLYGDFDLGTLI